MSSTLQTEPKNIKALMFGLRLIAALITGSFRCQTLVRDETLFASDISLSLLLSSVNAEVGV